MKFMQKKISTLLAFLLLIVGVVVTTILVQEKVIIFQQAAPSENPQDLRITNITDTSFTVTYTTTASVIGTVTIQGGNSNPQVVLDERDEQSGVPKPYYLHSISVKNLSQQTQYTFKIVSGSTTFVDGDKSFRITTPITLAAPTEQIPLAGKIVLPDGTKPDEALVFVTTENGQFLSSLLNPAGLYIIPLNTMRTKDFSAHVVFAPNSTLQILSTNGPLVSHVLTGITGINPTPLITLSQDYDFTIQKTPIASSSSLVKFPVLSFTQSTYTAMPEIIIPKNNESFTDSQPKFSGTASPNSTVTISIHSTTPVTIQITADANGNWSYRPTTPLSLGQHTIIITTPDQYGILHTLKQNFTVYAAGSQVSESATPSATLAPTLPPTATPVPTISSAVSPTLIPTQASTTSAATITVLPTLPPTGSNTITIAAVAGIATTVVGMILFLLTSGATL